MMFPLLFNRDLERRGVMLGQGLLVTNTFEVCREEMFR